MASEPVKKQKNKSPPGIGRDGMIFMCVTLCICFTCFALLAKYEPLYGA